MSEMNFHAIENNRSGNSSLFVNLLIIVFVAFIGIFAGYLVAKNFPKTNKQITKADNKTGSANNLSAKAGQKDTKLFPDVAEGTIKKGGIDGEGTHHLVRKGGKDQYVYLTSSVIDLNLYQNKKVKIWGKTYAAKTAGWLMDVGYLELL